MFKKYHLAHLFEKFTFKAESKAHLQRKVMKEIDLRLAKYSRRGIVLSVVVFALAIGVGKFYQLAPQLTLLLSSGLLLITFSRAIFLFRFETLYAQGPSRWRKLFFFYSFIGSCWWGLIVASVTWVVGVAHETPLLWLYTVTFFAGSIYVFAPFKRFLKLYMLVSFVPCALIAISQWEPISILYGAIMLILYILLCRQGNIVGQNYWDKLNATYDLLKKANSLEAEKISTESSLNKRDQLYANMTQELKAAMQEIAESLNLLKEIEMPDNDEQLLSLSEQKLQQQISLLKNVSELSSISSQQLMLDQQLIDLRFHIEQALSHVSLIVHKKNIELFSSFSNDFPLRVRADAERIEQLIGNLVSSASQFCPSGELLVSSHFKPAESTGKLSINVVNQSPPRTPETLATINASFSPYQTADIYLGLSLGIVRGIARLMGGDAGAEFNQEGALVFWMNVTLPLESSNVVSTPTLSKLVGKKVMLYQAPESIAGTFAKTLESWGLQVVNEDSEQNAIKLLEKAGDKSPFQLVIMYTRLNDMGALRLSKAVAGHSVLWSTAQIVILSQMQAKLGEVEEHFLKHANVEVIYKPIQQRFLQKAIKNLLVGKKESVFSDDDENNNLLEGKHLLLYQEEAIDIAIIQKILRKLGCEVTTANALDECLDLLSKTRFDAFICESHLYSVDLGDFVKQAREANSGLHNRNYKLPILGFTSRELESEQTQCLASGMEHYIHSPTTTEDLRAVLRRFIGRAIYMSENTR